MSDLVTPERREELLARVAKGIDMLNIKQPTWARDIPDPDNLDVSRGDRCVTAQLSGVWSWIAGKNKLGLSLPEYDACGFRIDDTENIPLVREAEYALLTEAWRAEIIRQTTD